MGAEVIVADVANHRLSTFSRRTGAFVRVIGGEGEEPGEFKSPRSLAVLHAQVDESASR